MCLNYTYYTKSVREIKFYIFHLFTIPRTIPCLITIFRFGEGICPPANGIFPAIFNFFNIYEKNPLS